MQRQRPETTQESDWQTVAQLIRQRGDDNRVVSLTRNQHSGDLPDDRFERWRVGRSSGIGSKPLRAEERRRRVFLQLPGLAEPVVAHRTADLQALAPYGELTIRRIMLSSELCALQLGPLVHLVAHGLVWCA